MPHRSFNRWTAALMLAAALSLAACATATVPVRDPAYVDTRIKPLIEALKLDTVALEGQYGLLRASAADYAFRADEQLNHIQKAALFVLNALESAKHQWEILSIVDYIKSDALGDYFTLRVQGLKRAAGDLSHDITLVDLYGAMLAAGTAREDVGHALTVLDAIQRDYEQLLSAMGPLANAPPRTALLEFNLAN